MSDAPRPMPEILAELQAAADEVTAQRLRFGYIADTIRVNALRNGATTEQVEDFIHGRASFVNWMAELVEARGKTENADLHAAEIAVLKARIDALVEALRRSEMALKPFADRVFNDNGDCTVTDTHLLRHADFWNAYSAANVVSAAIANAEKGEG